MGICEFLMTNPNSLFSKIKITMCLKAGTGRGVGIAVYVPVGIGTVAVRVGSGVRVDGMTVSVATGVIVDVGGIETGRGEQPARQNVIRRNTHRLMSVPSIQIAPA